MDREKLEQEANTLKLMFETYCRLNHHPNRYVFKETIDYKMFQKDIVFEKEFELCDECREILRYSLNRLQTCSFEEKPKCRKCKIKCYDKNHWKKVSQIMRYSGIKLGFIKLKNNMFNILKNS